jgi:hypothetical protein
MKLTPRGEMVIGLAYLLLVLTIMGIVGHIESL